MNPDKAPISDWDLSARLLDAMEASAKVVKLRRERAFLESLPRMRSQPQPVRRPKSKLSRKQRKAAHKGGTQ